MMEYPDISNKYSNVMLRACPDGLPNGFSKRLSRLMVLILFTIISGISSFGQGAKVISSLDSTSIFVGQELKLHLEATFSSKDTIQWPAFADTITGNIEILSMSKIDTAYDENDLSIKRMKQDIIITSFDSGYFPIPPVQFIVAGNSFLTDPLLIQVFDVPVDTSKGIADIKEPYQVPFSFKEWLEYNWHWIALGFGIILLTVGLFYYLKKHKERPAPIAPPKPKIPPHKTAIKRLNTLDQKKLWQHGKLKEYHSELSDIIREYIEHRFNINALEQTSWETIESFKHIDLDSRLKEKLQQTLTISDMVKFAKDTPIASENEICLKNCFEFVKETIEIEKPKTDE